MSKSIRIGTFEFSNVDAVAFDLYRKANKGTMVPYWMCMSESGKEECRQEFYNWARANMFPSYSNDVIAEIVNSVEVSDVVMKWANMELTAKAEREKGNPGYFML